MARPNEIELPDGTLMPILYEDRSVLAVDKPAGWMLAPATWRKTSRNLQETLVGMIRSGEFWSRSRNLRFLRFIHRLDAETTGVLLFCRSPGAVAAYSKLFEGQEVTKTYIAVVHGHPRETAWTDRSKIGPDTATRGRMRVDQRAGKPAETSFRVLAKGRGLALVEARPRTGRTHQIRVHLAAAGFPVVGDPLYPRASSKESADLALRAVELSYADPFTRRRVVIAAEREAFLEHHGFSVPEGVKR